ncbi:hypothetical protein X753_00365 [Mesorhizobium sp. LNJC399B00]|nr:hypothetical protein X753_00365 [Mesorhizobium sp. LNJC399B00]ESZ43658.1 hypothetical protein X730_27805 [Mesorhizobium sp. L103C565B0]
MGGIHQGLSASPIQMSYTALFGRRHQFFTSSAQGGSPEIDIRGVPIVNVLAEFLKADVTARLDLR